jgi:hypothetical protein
MVPTTTAWLAGVPLPEPVPVLSATATAPPASGNNAARLINNLLIR